MANVKKTAAAAAKTEAKAAAPVEKKAIVPAEKPAEAAKPEVKTEAKAEIKAAPAAAAEKKVAADKKAPAEKKAAAKKPAAKKTAKPAAKKAAAKKTVAKAEEKPAKRAYNRKPLTAADIAAKLEKKLDAKKAAGINGKVAVDIKLYGQFEAHIYIEVKDNKLTVAPYDYIERDIEAAISVENALAIINGKLTLADALADGRLYAFGNIGAAAKLSVLF